ncbi:hypothetical protein [Halostreptopolyspora alba]|uniref:Uncharacterized protein n=1 Tax=Halostreptopolyspora alba TaxID=2487137 RepID=A0A3N0DQF5_9ACTN|nr:hypothetical protein EFW17_23705 [Nocardiopsaceae bacterium YIM 96095]
MTDPELDRLRERFPVGSQVRPGPGMVDKDPHEIVGHTRMEKPFSAPMLLVRRPDGSTVRADPRWWRVVS